MPGLRSTFPLGSLTSKGTAFSGSEPSAPASMIVSYSESSGTPATTPSISSYSGLALRQVACISPTTLATSVRRSSRSRP